MVQFHLVLLKLVYKIMPKFYVKSGELKVVLIADNPFDACCKSIDSITGRKVVSHEFDVNRKGFESEPELSFGSELVIEAAGWEWE